MLKNLASCFSRSSSSYENSALVQKTVAETLASLAAPCLPNDAVIFEVGCGTGFLSRLLLSSLPSSTLIINDISDAMLRATAARLPHDVSLLPGDAERISWPAANVIVSSSAVQWFSDPLNFVRKASETLPPDGVLAFSTYGPATFSELRDDASAASLYPSLEVWKTALRKCGFSISTSRTIVRTLSFPSRFSLLRHIVETGVGYKRQRQSVPHPPYKLTYEAFLFLAVRK